MLSSNPNDNPTTRRHIPDEIAPLGDAETFAALMECMVADQAPRLFAVVQEYGERLDGRIAAWGMAFDDHADVVGIGGVQLSTRSPETALARFVRGDRITPHLVWVNPDATMPPD